MGKKEEAELLVPTLKYVLNNPGCMTEDIIKYLVNIMDLSEEDLEILAGRNDSKFSQIVRNLTSSHYENNDFGKFVNREKKGRFYSFYINEKGLTFLNTKAEDDLQDLIDDEKCVDEILDADEYTDNSIIEDANNRIPERKNGTASKRFKTDSKIAKTVLVKCGYVCQFATLAGEEHKTFDAKRGTKYLEAHHLIPMKAQNDFLPINLDRTQNIVGLCPLCHARVHHGTLEEKKVVLKKLYEAMIDDLKKEGINIDFSDLLLKYYS